VLEQLSEDKAVVSLLWSYEVGNGLLMACRRKRISYDQAGGYLARLRRLPVLLDDVDSTLILTLPDFARKHDLTNYDSAY
jgi:predicted nucleic acid-binding protein